MTNNFMPNLFRPGRCKSFLRESHTRVDCKARTQAPNGVVYTAVLNLVLSIVLNLDLVLNLVLDKFSTRLGCLHSSGRIKSAL